MLLLVDRPQVSKVQRQCGEAQRLAERRSSQGGRCSHERGGRSPTRLSSTSLPESLSPGYPHAAMWLAGRPTPLSQTSFSSMSLYGSEMGLAVPAVAVSPNYERDPRTCSCAHLLLCLNACQCLYPLSSVVFKPRRSVRGAPPDGNEDV